MQKAGVRDQGYGNNNKHSRRTIQQEPPTAPRGDGDDVVKGEEEDDEPSYRVDCFYGELRHGEEQWKEGDVAGDGEGPEGGEVAAILERQETPVVISLQPD